MTAATAAGASPTRGGGQEGQHGTVGWNPLLGHSPAAGDAAPPGVRRWRPGFLDVLFEPAFLIPLVVSTVGFFFCRSWTEGSFSGPGGRAERVLAARAGLDLIFRPRHAGNPLFYSALIPVLATLLLYETSGYAESWPACHRRRRAPVVPRLLPHQRRQLIPDVLDSGWLVLNSAIAFVTGYAILRK